ncbi:MAG: rhodanese-like domain-containing protein [Erysipelotrichaceae bacterium]
MFNLFKSSNLSQSQAFKELGEDITIKLIDVRTSAEFKEGHIAASVNIPLDTLESKLAKSLPDKDAKIFVVCLSGSRASSAVSYMKKIGYTHVFNIGGVSTWTYGLTKK